MRCPVAMAETAAEAVILEGVLHKRRAGKLNVLVAKPWDQRWFVLTSESLQYYSSKETCDWGLPPKVLSIQGLRHFESLSDTVFQLYFAGRILQLKAECKSTADRWLACLHSLHVIVVSTSFTQNAIKQQSAADSHISKLQQHDSAASVAAPRLSQKPTRWQDEGVLFITVDAACLKPATLDEHISGHLSHLSIDRSTLSFTPLSDQAATSPFLAGHEQQAIISLQPVAETTICSRCRSCTSTLALPVQQQQEIQQVSHEEDNNPTEFEQPVWQEAESQVGSPLPQPSANLDWLQRHLSASPFDRSFTAGSVTDEECYALPQGARAGRLEPSIDVEGLPDSPLAAAAAQPNSNADDTGLDAYPDTECTADTSQWHHHADGQMQVSMVLNKSPGSKQQNPLHSPGSQVGFADAITHAPADGTQAVPSCSQTEYMAQTEHAGSIPERMHSSFASAWLHSTDSSTLSSQTGQAEPAAMQAWASHTMQQLPASSSSASVSDLDDIQPHPPAVPSTSQGLISAPSGFRGRRGVSGDPRLRRFRNASTAGDRVTALFTHTSHEGVKSGHGGLVDTAWGSSRPQHTAALLTHAAANNAEVHTWTPTHSWTAYCSDSDEPCDSGP